MSDDDAEEYIRGPGPGYKPPAPEELQDPDWRANVEKRGAKACREALAKHGIRFVDGKWDHDRSVADHTPEE